MNNTVTENDTRTERQKAVDGIRALADFLEAHPDLDAPDTDRFHVCLTWNGDPKAEMAKWARAASHLKPVKDFDSDQFARLLIPFGPTSIEVFANRSQICERVVTGVTQVTETVPDPELVKAVPLVEVTREIEDVEWVCTPLLDDGSSWASAS
jgi:hypothetical protein